MRGLGVAAVLVVSIIGAVALGEVVLRFAQRGERPHRYMVSDPVLQYEHTVGLNFLPAPSIRIRGETTAHRYVGDAPNIDGENRDYLSLQTSFTVSF